LVTKDHVKLVAWPARNPVPGAYTAIEDVVNRGAVETIAENEPLTNLKLAAPGVGAGLSPTIPTGMRAVSVRVNEVIGVAGFVIPGTRVDLLVTVHEPNSGAQITRAVVNNLTVLTAGTRYDIERAQGDGKAIPTSVVTLLATPQDAEKIALAATEGKIMLTLRNPLDTLPTDTHGVRMAGLLGAPAPAPVEKTVKGRKVMVAATPPPAAAPPPPRLYTVQAIRAAKVSEETVKESNR
jgi:pilus assembly protein CpaB